MISTILEKIAHILLAIVLPLQYYFLFIGGMMALDTLLRVIVLIKAKNLKGNIESIIDTLKLKMLIYTPIALSVYWIDALFLNEIVTSFVSIEMASTKLMAVLLVFDELKSIDNHFGTLTGKTIVDRFYSVTDAFKTIKDKLKSSSEL